MGPAITRRNVLGLLLTEFVRFPDPATENIVVRLTSPAYTNLLPSASNQFVSLKPHVLYFSSDRVNRRLQPFAVDLRTGLVKQIGEAEALDPLSLTLDGQYRAALYFLDGGTLVLSRPKRDVLAQDVSAFGVGKNRAELYVVSRGNLQLLGKSEGTPVAADAAGPCLVRPGARGGCLFTRSEGREFWYAVAGGKAVRLAQGDIASPRWSADGVSLFFLRDVPKNNVLVSEIHEVKPEEGMERCLFRTSQFATFSTNSDDSVFVGASKSRAQPHILLLLRATGREFTLCEHRATQAAKTQPVFAPDSRRVYFQSDREGKSAIYSVNVEKLIEPTE